MANEKKIPIWLQILVLTISVIGFGGNIALKTFNVMETSKDAKAIATQVEEDVENATMLYLELAQVVKDCKADINVHVVKSNGKMNLIESKIEDLERSNIESENRDAMQTEAINAQTIAVTKLVENVIALNRAVERMENK